MSFLRSNKGLLLYLVVLIFALFSAYLILTTSARHDWDRHLSLLAAQLLRGHTALLPNQDLPFGDIVDFHANYYLFYGPLSSIFLMPFVFVFGKNFPQVLIGIGSMIASFIAVYFISKSFNFKKLDSLWLSLFFVFSTVLFSSGLINITAYQVEVLGVPLILFGLNEYFSKKRPFIIGLFLGLAVLARVLLALSFVFFIVEFLQKRLNKKQLLLIFIPVLVALIILGLYNQRRFHSFFETGYQYDITLKTFPLSINLSQGYMSSAHIPANLYSLLIMPPEPLLAYEQGFVLKFPYLRVSPWGTAIWFTSPLFLVLLYKFKKGKYSLSALISIIVILIPIVSYYSIGFSQFGYRYVLDFLPFLLLLLLPTLKGKLTKGDIFLIILGVAFNCIYITSLWGDYPLFGIK